MDVKRYQTPKKKELKALNLPLKLRHYTIHYYNYQTLYNHCNTNHSHNLDLSSIYNIHSFHQHYLDSDIRKLLTQKKMKMENEMKRRIYMLYVYEGSYISVRVHVGAEIHSYLKRGLYSYKCSELIWGYALSFRHQACSRHSSVWVLHKLGETLHGHLHKIWCNYVLFSEQYCH